MIWNDRVVVFYLFIFIFGGPYNKLKTEIELSKEDKENFLH